MAAGDTLREVLRVALDECRAAVADLEAGRETVSPDRAIGRLSRLEALNDQGVRNLRIERTRRRVSALESALARVDDEDFGLCDACGEPIPEARLLLVPESRVCIGCAEAGGN